MNDIYDLQRFVDAQERVYASVVRELRAGQKQGHWMWFIFPQLKALGVSEMSQKYGIGSSQEAVAYAKHPLLGSRLRECTQCVLGIDGRRADQIFPYPDDLKFRSCMTLFEHAVAENTVFREAIAKYFDGEPDNQTLRILAADDA